MLQAQLYGSSYTLFNNEFKQLGIEVTIVDVGAQQTWKAALKPNTKVSFSALQRI